MGDAEDGDGDLRGCSDETILLEDVSLVRSCRRKSSSSSSVIENCDSIEIYSGNREREREREGERERERERGGGREGGRGTGVGSE